RYDEIDSASQPSLLNVSPEETGYMTGCAFLIKAKVIREIGLLCEDFFLYYEDTDWSLRAKKAGYKIMYVPAAKIYHKVSRTASVLGNPTIHYYHIRNALLLSKRQAPKIILAGIYIWSVSHYLKQIIKLAILPSKREISKMIMRGIEDFWKGKFGKYGNSE
ncbi:MAG: glycosyltransferase family 2 protein, partial [Patescibacteria group bacterium]